MDAQNQMTLYPYNAGNMTMTIPIAKFADLHDKIKELQAQVERLTKAGDELHVFLINYIVESRISSAYLNKLDDDWHAAKESKPSV